MFPTKRTVPSLLALFSGILFILISILQGEADVALFVIIPVIYGSGIYLAIGIFLIFLSFILFFVFSAVGLKKEMSRKEKTDHRGKKVKTESKYGGVIFIGPIPIIFGKDKSISKKMMYVGLVIAVILLFLYFLVFYY